MSDLSILPVSSAGSASGSALLQAQAQRYASDFSTLQNAIQSGDLAGAQKALATFLKDSAMATVNGFDPVNQNAASRQDFTSVKSALGNGDINGAQTAFAALQTDMQGAKSGIGNDVQAIQNAVQSGNLATAQSSLAAFAKDVAMTATSDSNPLAPGKSLLQDIRSLQIAFQSGDIQNARDTLSSVRDNLTGAAWNIPSFGSGAATPSAYSKDEGIIQTLAGAPGGTDAPSALQASTLAILQSLQTRSSGNDSSSAFTVTPEMIEKL